MPLWTIFLLFVLLVPGPLFAVFCGPRHRGRRPLALLVAVPLLLFAINAPLHDLGHMIGTWLGGGRVTEYNLVMKLRTSSPRVPMIVTTGLETPSVRITASFFPYGVALAFLLTGLLLGRRIDGSTPWLQALFHLLFVPRPGFDVAPISSATSPSGPATSRTCPPSSLLLCSPSSRSAWA